MAEQLKGYAITDLSVAPSNVSAVSMSSRYRSGNAYTFLKNTYSTAVAIGEKAAIIIGEDMNIQAREWIDNIPRVASFRV